MTDIHEIEALLEQQDEDYDFGWFHWLFEGHTDEFHILSDDYMARTVHTVGGHEGGGENVEVVVEVSPHVGGIKKFSMESRFFKKLGWYASFAGTDFDGPMIEVQPRQKTITVYEKG